MSLLPPSQDGDILDLTIRFSASLPDLLLTIPLPSPKSTHPNTATLKQQIRTRLPTEYTTHRIRLIHAGKALVDDAPLNTSLKRPLSRPPSRVSTPGPYDDSNSPTARLKGKTPIRDPPINTRIYIHCSIGDIVLNPAELAAEAALAQPSQHATTKTTLNPGPPETEQDAPAAAPTPTHHGFDRLLTSGFSAAEVASLRLQFLAIQAHTHTPDTMPSPTTLRTMEDQWLDNSDAHPDSLDMAGDGGEEGQRGELDDMIFGTAMGFFWPVGCLMWAVREEGIWSERRKMMVVVGVVMNLGLGIVRYTK